MRASLERVRVRLLVLTALALVGVVGGGTAAYVSAGSPASSGVAAPVPGTPDVPTTPPDPVVTPEPYADDIDYPALTTPRGFDRLRLVNDLQGWSYVRPADWQAFRILQGGSEAAVGDAGLSRLGEVRFRPADEPVEGGYSLRVKAVDDHVPPGSMVTRKVADLEQLEDFTPITQTDDAIYFTYRTPSDRLRYNFFRWFAAPGSAEATLEMSVVGRAADELGLKGLFAAFADRLRPLT